jgi:hypothetical protein
MYGGYFTIHKMIAIPLSMNKISHTEVFQSQGYKGIVWRPRTSNEYEVYPSGQKT